MKRVRSARQDEPAPVLRLVVPQVPERLAEVRGAVGDFLDAHGIDERAVRHALLCVEEACTNALLHSGSMHPPSLELVLEDECVRVSVSDAGMGIQEEHLAGELPADPLSPGGRGLYLIRHYAKSFEVDREGGTTIRFTIDRAAQAPASSGDRAEDGDGDR